MKHSETYPVTHPTTPSANQDQFALWNGPSGNAWVDNRAALDQMFVPLARFLIDRVHEAARRLPSGRLLDVGCGTGGATLAIASSLGERWQCTGADISAPMIAVARSRAAHARTPVEFLSGDVQTHDFPARQFDLVVSRLGVMFFDDPVAAFVNLRKAAKPRARLHALAWRSVAENPFMTAAERAVMHLLPSLPPRQTGAPGQFAFAQRERVESVLAASGWEDVALTPVHFECTFAVADLREYVSRLGPVGLALATLQPSERERVVDAAVQAFAPFTDGHEMRFTAACWHLAARAPA
ncbi:class I SAM-dependent methyltransferase [Pandoraea pulmonicola]|uniref:Demethylmenaquinone methyltransferase n=1 Tax=Pandoraea pulmonicola TaxID=93221 RepID=A0AAJ5D079_PANPU|nr:class I SAM-dependent methyltransferase [Pandoraea pulmonicola]AJC23282.2 SAM-dependent methyltransferase [Pandoraea pulmonicola]SUA90383.1 Demethylmenaquinone methyltransferase [Pandoraea pulmonicola]